ncbi:hypothetical protein [Gilliamella apicola]|uniref:hypothetical protein n=1 Tax=Gilliamella apicola TaxID=1196095 RepID=UPI00042F2BC0|nr:hypothetical protein [Gilliamella apicola]AHN26938.1 hypothetical protein GAPWK_2365 [Gilliamella apicola]ORF44360.1 hypothetical protein B5800_12000 [Gilliamella apicola]ORF48384.1 hypothetical protein B5799_08980 [Gilliamella apicola]ORF51846.1 hypothetical protein B5803_06105 [Gilliamella apicola]ORF55341.1 hypothetical protein B5798_04250 [Gilliamella apicola]
MKKQTLPCSITLCTLLLSPTVMALNCGEDPAQNRVQANNYIFQILDFIDLPIQGIKHEVRTSTTIINNRNESTAKHILNYDENGLITQSQYILYSDNNKRVYSENLQKTAVGWENFIEDLEYKTSSIIQFKTDEQGKIVESQQAKKALDFIFTATDSYQYDSNNCLISKQVQWKVKGIDDKGKFTGVDQNGASAYTFNYQQHQLAKVLYQFSNNTQNESNFLYQYDNNYRLTAIQSAYLSASKDVVNYTTQFLTFDDKNDWLTATKIRQDQKNKQTNIVREITYY